MKVLPGTVAFEAVSFLSRTGFEMTTARLAVFIGRSAKRLPKHMTTAVQCGLVARRVASNGTVLWSRGAAVLVAPPKPAVSVQPGPLAHPSVFHYAAAVAASLEGGA